MTTPTHARARAQRRAPRWDARTRVLAGSSVVALALLGSGGIAVASLRTDVVLEVDGVSQPVTVWGSTVADVLAGAGVVPGSHDLVSPSAAATVGDGDTVVVRTAHPFDLSVDGTVRTVWTTSSSADTILADADAAGSDVTMAADRSGSRSTLVPLVSRTRSVTVRVGSASTTVRVRPGDDVRAALAAAGVSLSPIDTVTIGSAGGLLLVDVTRVSRGLLTEHKPIAFDEREVGTSTLFEGESRVTTPGSTGTTTVTEWAETRDGDVVHSTVLSQATTRNPTSQVREVGTRPVTPRALAEDGIDPKATLEEKVEADGTTSVRYRAPLGSISSPAEVAQALGTAGGDATAGMTYSGESPQGIAQGMVQARGWPATEFQCLVTLWNRESGWNPYAGSPSGAYGIPQALPGSKMAGAGEDWLTNPTTQITWGLGYISGRYGTPCAALAHSDATGWY